MQKISDKGQRSEDQKRQMWAPIHVIHKKYKNVIFKFRIQISIHDFWFYDIICIEIENLVINNDE